MKFIKRHITAIIVIIVCLILMLLAGFAVYRMFYPSNDKSVYGDRSEGFVEIPNDSIEKIKSDINETGLVNSVTYKLNSSKTGMVFFVDVKEDTKIDTAKKLSEHVLNNLSKDILGFYDITINLTQKNGNMSEYPAVGQHSEGASTFYWVVNKEVEDSEE